MPALSNHVCSEEKCYGVKAGRQMGQKKSHHHGAEKADIVSGQT